VDKKSVFFKKILFSVLSTLCPLMAKRINPLLSPSLTELPEEAKVKMRTKSSSPARVIDELRSSSPFAAARVNEQEVKGYKSFVLLKQFLPAISRLLAVLW